MQVFTRLFFYSLMLLCLTRCGLQPYEVIDSTNQNSRVNYLVIHATSENFGESIRLLTTPTNNPVSSHYLVPAENDATYDHSNLRIYSLVPEHRRAWHAGLSQWGRETALNDRSIGIEVVNEFKCEGAEGELSNIDLSAVTCIFPPYSQRQIDLLIELIEDILLRYPDIQPINVVGHSDIAIMRKSDPGPVFPWYALYQRGIGAWPDSADVKTFYQQASQGMPSIAAVQTALALLGYGIEVSGELDQATQFAVRALQLHFRPQNYSGEIDAETVAILWALIKKYREREFEEYSSELVFG
jgi:N-acetylmuramoyl-L-alanine amidase